MEKVNARVLDPPALTYSGGGKQGGALERPRGGKWDTSRGKSHFYDAKSLTHWGVLNLAGTRQEVQKNFVNELYKVRLCCSSSVPKDKSS